MRSRGFVPHSRDPWCKGDETGRQEKRFSEQVLSCFPLRRAQGLELVETVAFLINPSGPLRLCVSNAFCLRLRRVGASAFKFLWLRLLCPGEEVFICALTFSPLSCRSCGVGRRVGRSRLAEAARRRLEIGAGAGQTAAAVTRMAVTTARESSKPRIKSASAGKSRRCGNTHRKESNHYGYSQRNALRGSASFKRAAER